MKNYSVIPFNKPYKSEKYLAYIEDAFKEKFLRGDGEYCKKCGEWLESRFGALRALLTPSCSAALEMAAILCNIEPGDEVIMPSFTFCSTANAFVLRGAKIVFVDVRPDTMNIDEKQIEAAITSKTKAIAAVHYAGVACEMDTIMAIAKKHSIFVIEDAAQAVMSTYKGKALGTIGDFGCFSFHETKNYSMGEGGALLINNKEFVERAEIIREKGTNRAQFLRGQIDKYTWVDMGSSFLPNELASAYLYGQLEMAEEINTDRLSSWDLYYKLLSPLKEKGLIELPVVPDECVHNAHMFYIKVSDIEERTKLIEYLKENGAVALFHYVPLHSAEAGRKFGKFFGDDLVTTRDSERIIRLPMYYNLGKENVEKVCELIAEYYK